MNFKPYNLQILVFFINFATYKNLLYYEKIPPDNIIRIAHGFMWHP